MAKLGLIIAPIGVLVWLLGAYGAVPAGYGDSALAIAIRAEVWRQAGGLLFIAGAILTGAGFIRLAVLGVDIDGHALRRPSRPEGTIEKPPHG